MLKIDVCTVRSIFIDNFTTSTKFIQLLVLEIMLVHIVHDNERKELYLYHRRKNLCLKLITPLSLIFDFITIEKKFIHHLAIHILHDEYEPPVNEVYFYLYRRKIAYWQGKLNYFWFDKTKNMYWTYYFVSNMFQSFSIPSLAQSQS